MDSNRVVNHIVHWLKDYASKADAKGFIVGVSGGIDSAVTSALCARTGLKVICLEMPIHQNASQVARGRKHIDQLILNFPRVQCQEVELTAVFNAFMDVLPRPGNAELHEFSLVNTRARFRMTTLYYFAALNQCIVAGTGNKVEDFGVGFYTKYGDGGVDLSPIADLLKTEVYTIAKELGIIQEIMEAPPTDGLWGDDRTDEDQIGATYPELEWAMSFHGSENELTDKEKRVLKIYRDHNRRNQHKMKPIPVCEIPAGMK